MPKPVGSGQRYMPGLDGLRAVAVLAVIAYHEQFSWAQGGLLGVGVFFTLSGFLITGLLLDQRTSDGRLRLGDFWLRRARRLLPALFVMLAIVTAWVTVADRARLAGLRGADGAAAAYFSNWYLIARNQSYFARFAPPAPLDHLWSLAVEEQFYLLWPLVLLVGLMVLRRRSEASARWLILPTLALTAGSAFAMVHLYQPGMDPTRVYEGTDTRAFGLLVGAILALAWPGAGKSRSPHGPARVLVDGAGIAGLVVIGLMIWRVGQYSTFAYRGGLVLLSVATAAVVAAAAFPRTLVGIGLGWSVLRWIGARSYGIYLWHFPVIVLTTPANSGPDLARAAVQVTATIVFAALSWRFIEEPIRHGAIGRIWANVRAARGRVRPIRTADIRRAAATTGALGIVVVAVAGLSGTVHGPAAGAVSGIPGAIAGGALQQPVTRSVVNTGTRATSGRSGGAASQRGGQGSAQRSAQLGWFAALGSRRIVDGSPGTGGPWMVGGMPAAQGQLRTSCQGVAHIGDSTSDGLNSPAYLPNRAQRIPARYQDVGARVVVTDIEGARSIFEVLPGGVSAADAAKAIIRHGFRGCWVLALGTDDTADVAAGSNYSIMTRIARMMAVTRGEPVMWVNVKSLVHSGPYAESNMQRWNAALLRACARYPNMRIYDWATEAQSSWFISDGIHYSSFGYARRAQMIANALANAFPLTGQSTGCVVGS